MKLCKNCKHYKGYNGGHSGPGFHRCYRMVVQPVVCLVTGSVSQSPNDLTKDCVVERRLEGWGICGEEGKYWEEK